MHADVNSCGKVSFRIAMHADINQSLTLNSVALLERRSVVILISEYITSVLISSKFPHDLKGDPQKKMSASLLSPLRSPVVVPDVRHISYSLSRPQCHLATMPIH